MDKSINEDRFPEKDESSKYHGIHDNTDEKEKYLRDSGKIEDLPASSEIPKMNTDTRNKNESSHLTDRSGEERTEDYINTDERQRDLRNRGIEP